MSTSPHRQRAALYKRVSGALGQTTSNQSPDLERLAAVRGLEIVEVFDEVMSAAKVRPEFDRMLKAAHAGKFDVLLVWSLDRFGRSMVGNLQAVLELDRIGVKVVSVQEPWLDTGGPVRTLLVGIFSWIAEQERERLISRTKAGLDRARRQGKRLGRPPASPVLLSAARDLVHAGVPVAEAARRKGVPRSTLQRFLRSNVPALG
jgi:DNA invertase Pin-like site-specific DNA recombinase